MNRKHPSERELQQFANRSCDEVQRHRVRKHVETCEPCRRIADGYLELDKRLEEMEDELPSPAFTDNVMAALASERLREEQGRQEQSVASRKRTSVPIRYWRPELTNLFAAAAATYLFIHLGILQQIVTLDTGLLESGLRGKVEIVIGFVDKVTVQMRH
ncbi:anti-sigma factor family protein [Paenibacillus sp. MBLB4367]|uniref:anti-sigma factor family protein n=1 Tax=Paenibacillus sp. MBLB4367 TaxID=3384767 RepID=UPI0039082F21